MSLDPTGTGRRRWAARWKPALNDRPDGGAAFYSRTDQGDRMAATR